MTTPDWTVTLHGTSRPSLVVGGWGAVDALPAHASALSERGARLFVVADRAVWKRWREPLNDRFSFPHGLPDTFLVEPGESSKTVAGAAALWGWLAEVGCRRDDVVAAVGGGVVGDLVGFAAATYLRGVGLWQVPTTLLSQVDSSVGGKVAVNLPAGKNLVGTFYQPDLVVADQAFLTSLPPEELSSGLGEVVKYALLSGVSFMEDLQADADRIVALEPAALSAVVERCVRIKADVVALDEKDTGGRAVLNLGHTIGHALEHAAGYGNLSHGAAVGLGILAALRVSESACGLDPSLLPRVRGLLALFGLPTRIDGVSRDAILAAVPRDKKTSAEGLGFVCLRSPGDPKWGVRVERETLASALEVILE